MPHFQLVKEDGTAFGAIELGRPDWPIGSVIHMGDKELDLRVVARLDDGDPDPEKFAILVVEDVRGVAVSTPA